MIARCGIKSNWMPSLADTTSRLLINDNDTDRVNVSTTERIQMSFPPIPEDLFAFLHNYTEPDWSSSDVDAICVSRL